MIEFTLPYPPSVNHYWRRAGASVFLSCEGREFRAKVCSLLAAQGIQPLNGPLNLEAIVFPPDKRRRDIDNVQKALLDALQHGGAYHDDSQIVRLCIERAHPVSGGRTVVRIVQAKTASNGSE